MSTAVIVGRFQAPYLHPGHLYLIGTAAQECDEVVILLGTQEGIDERNQYTFEQRAQMIYKVFRQAIIYRLADDPDDGVWSQNLDEKVKLKKDITLYHSRDSFKDHYSGIHPLKELPELPGFSATKLRETCTEKLMVI